MTIDLSSPLPLLPLRHSVVLPGRVTTIPVGRPRSRSLAESLRPGDFLALAVQRDPAMEDPSLVDLFPIATLARVQERTDRGARGIVLVVDAQARVALRSLAQAAPFWTARVEAVTEVPGGAEASELAVRLRGVLTELAPADAGLHESLASARDPGLLADRAAAWLEVEDARKAAVLAELDHSRRLRLVFELLGEATTARTRSARSSRAWCCPKRCARSSTGSCVASSRSGRTRRRRTSSATTSSG